MDGEPPQIPPQEAGAITEVYFFIIATVIKKQRIELQSALTFIILIQNLLSQVLCLTFLN